MARKGENIYERKDGRWEGRYIKGRRPNGRALYGSVYGKKYGEVKEKLIPLKAAHAANRNNVRASFSGTVWDWLSYWLDVLEKPRIKPSTYASYRNKLENHVLPALGEKKLANLTEQDLQNWIDGLTANSLAGSSVGTIFRILNAALRKAVSSHYLFIDPCKNLSLPGSKSTGIRVLTISAQKDLEREAMRSKGNAAVIIALYTGMRIGEISALQWSDIDFDNSLIHVRRTLQRIGSYKDGKAKTKIIMDLPKSDASYRIIPFAGHLKKYLLKLKDVSNSNYIVSCKGRFTEPRVISYRFRQAAVRAGLKDATFHSLRHTYATRCIERGVDIVSISRLLGHSSSKLTLDTYAGSTMEQRRAAMGTLDMLLPKDITEVRDNSTWMVNRQVLSILLEKLFNKELFAAS